MRKLMMIAAACVALMCIATTAMAQKDRYMQEGYYFAHFQKLPPLKTDFDISLSPHFQSNPLQVTFQNLQQKDSTDNQSIMLRHKVRNEPTQYHYKQPKYMMTGDGDGFKDLRDHIVRKRRIDEGRPLQPLPPVRFR